MWIVYCYVLYCLLTLLLNFLLHLARVGPSVPRQDRPVREGTRVASIETGLAAAAAKLSQQVSFPNRVLPSLPQNVFVFLETFHGSLFSMNKLLMRRLIKGGPAFDLKNYAILQSSELYGKPASAEGFLSKSFWELCLECQVSLPNGRPFWNWCWFHLLKVNADTCRQSLICCSPYHCCLYCHLPVLFSAQSLYSLLFQWGLSLHTLTLQLATLEVSFWVVFSPVQVNMPTTS